jgi:hypothetical protein
MTWLSLSNKSLRTRFGLMIGANVLATGLLLAQALLSFERLNRDAERSFVAKDVVADILPPPMYLIELRLLLSEAVEGSISSDKAKQQFNRLEAEYQARAKYWAANPPEGLEKQLLGEQHQLALQMLEQSRNLVLTPLERNDAEAAKAGLLRVHQSRHRLCRISHREFQSRPPSGRSDAADGRRHRSVGCGRQPVDFAKNHHGLFATSLWRGTLGGRGRFAGPGCTSTNPRRRAQPQRVAGSSQ